MKLEDLKTKNFEAKEFWQSVRATRENIDNKPFNKSIITCLYHTANKMQEVRNILEKPIKITSAFRCEKLNKLVGGSPKSKHMQGLAIDFICPDFGTPEQIVRFLHSKGFSVDQCLIESSWVHISWELVDSKNRNMYGFWINNKFKAI